MVERNLVQILRNLMLVKHYKSWYTKCIIQYMGVKL